MLQQPLVFCLTDEFQYIFSRLRERFIERLTKMCYISKPSTFYNLLSISFWCHGSHFIRQINDSCLFVQLYDFQDDFREYNSTTSVMFLSPLVKLPIKRDRKDVFQLSFINIHIFCPPLSYIHVLSSSYNHISRCNQFSSDML